MTNPWKNAKAGEVWYDPQAKVDRRITGVVAEGFDTDARDNWRQWTAATREEEKDGETVVVEFKKEMPYVAAVAKWTRKE